MFKFPLLVLGVSIATMATFGSEISVNNEKEASHLTDYPNELLASNSTKKCPTNASDLSQLVGDFNPLKAY